MPEKNNQDLLKELRKLKQENEALKASDETTVSHRELIEKMRSFEWILKQKHTAKQSYAPEYGDLSLLNKDGLIKKSTTKDQLQDIVSEYLDLLETSAAIYEKNGDYALGIFSSGWCQMMDVASHRLCSSDDNRKALASGKWLCHDSCWKDASLKSMNEGKTTEVACNGGLHLYAVPVWANKQIIGAINFGFGSPPKDDAELKKLSEKFKIPLQELQEHSMAYKDRPQFIIDYAKQRIHNSAKHLGYLVERKIAEDRLLEIKERYRTTLYSIGDGVITTDKAGRITNMNAAAEGYCGWAFTDAAGKHMSEVFRIINATTRKAVDDPVEKVLKSEKVIGLANHTVLISKNGKEYQIADSAAPIKNRDGEITGVVLVFADITEKYKTEEKLRESEERLDMAMMVKNDGMWDWDLVTNSTFFDDRYYTMAGYAPGDFPKTFAGWAEHVHPEDLQASKDAIKAYISGASDDFNIEFRFRQQDGSWMWIEGKGKIIDRDKSGKPLRMIGTHNDITHRKRVEMRLKDSEEKHRLLFETANDAILIIENDVFVDCNSKAEEVFGCKKEQIIGKTLFDFSTEFQPDGSASAALAKERIKATVAGENQFFEWHHKRFDGSLLDAEISLSAFTINNKTLIQSIVRDLTERKETEKTKQVLFQIANEVLHNFKLDDFINAVEQQLSQLVDTTNFYIALYDSEIGMLSAPFEKDEKDQIDTWPANGSATGLVIDNKQSVLLQKQDVLRLIETGEIEQTGSICESWLGVPLFKGTDVSGVIVVQSYDNPEAFDSNTMELFEYVSNQISMALERARVFEDLVQAKNKAEESDRLKSAFLANMSHEIRTPMNGILGFAGLLKEPQLSGEQQQKYIQIIEKSGARMLNIINDIVSISKIESGLMDIHLSEMNINTQLQFVYDVLKLDADNKKLKLSFNCGFTEKEAIIKTDSDKIYGILSNLVKNAIKYTDSGTIEFGYNFVETHGRASHGRASLRFYVKDTGIGIPKDRQEAIFERFIQVDIADKMARQGAGLGLAISKAYVEMLGGNIWVESEEGKGSIFYFSLPYNAEPVKNTIDWQLEPSGQRDDIRKLKILMVEDDEVSEMLLDETVKLLGKEILKARTGVEAVEACHNNPDIDLVLMDIQMPEMGGYEATKQIREFNKEVIIIAQTAYGMTGDRERAIKSGCNDYIAKPINKTELQAFIHKYFEKCRP